MTLPKSIFGVLTWDLGFNRGQEVCILSSPSQGVAPSITGPSLSWLQSLLGGSQTGSQNYVKYLSRRQVPPLTGTRLQPYSPLSVRFLGNSRSLGTIVSVDRIAKWEAQCLFRISSLLQRLQWHGSGRWGVLWIQQKTCGSEGGASYLDRDRSSGSLFSVSKSCHLWVPFSEHHISIEFMKQKWIQENGLISTTQTVENKSPVSLCPLIPECDNIIGQNETKTKKYEYVNCEISS